MAGKKTLRSELEEPGVLGRFITRLKQKLPPGVGLAEEIADVLDMSIDSAYRRIRGETGFTIDEIFRITSKHVISVDDVFNNRSDTVTFTYTKLTDSAKNFEEYLARLYGHIKTINKFPNRKVYYVAEEIPIFWSFQSPRFIEFKLFYWQRSVLNVSEYQNMKFSFGLIPENLVKLAHDSYLEYMGVPSVEVWTDLTVLTGLRQVGFYFDSGVINKEQALELLREYRKTVEYIQNRAEVARKQDSDPEETYFLYSSEVVLGTNCIYVVMGDARYSYISFNTMNSLTTNNPAFCDETGHWVRSLEKKSTLISGVGEIPRYKFFAGMFAKIDEAIEKTAGA